MSNLFEDFIIQCCKSPEHELRKWIKKILSRNGFRIIEDNYISERVKNDPRLANVHNLLAIRGDKPKVCLVSHTDVCRDHGSIASSIIHNSWAQSHDSKKSDDNKKPERRQAEPVIKRAVRMDKSEIRIIQDKESLTQVGGDDRLGCAINLWIALNTGYDMGILFPTDEEIGLKSSRANNIEELKSFELLAQVDRGNHSHELVTKISGEILCDYDTTVRLLMIAYNIDLPRKIVNGMGTDVVELKRRKMCKNAVNMTCGYHNSWGDDGKEYIDIQEAKDTMKFVASIIKSYDLDDN